MHEILSFPNKIEAANQFIHATFEYAATPPDYADGFEERQYQYAKLGIDAYELACKLRDHAGLPSKPQSDWSAEDYLRDRIAKIKNLRTEREAKHPEMLNTLAESKARDLLP
ncbi:hypothetical protein D3C78_1600300 [compost metagenome]